jgi:VIT1/CCC1 family predicted Fe2+/Mn2+ transporter
LLAASRPATYRGRVTTPTGQSTEHQGLEHDVSVGARLNWLRAGVLGANDGIVSVAGIVVGVAGATTDRTAILTAGVAGLAAGALSMASGEYVSVSTQRDTERALLVKEARELREMPEEELEELVQIYRDKGLSERLAREVAVELTARDAFAAHVDAELGIDPDDLTNPWHAAGSSARVPVTFVAVVLALAATGLLSARLGDAVRHRAVWRNVAGGMLAMAVTYGIGQLVGGLVL